MNVPTVVIVRDIELSMTLKNEGLLYSVNKLTI